MKQSADDDIPRTNYAGYTSNLLDPFLFHMDSLFSLGSRKQLKVADLGLLPPESRTRHVLDIIDEYWKNELKLPKEQRSIVRTIRLSIGASSIVFGYFLHGINAASAFSGPMMLKQLLQHLSGENKLTPSTLWIFLCLLLISPILGMLCKEYGNLVVLRWGMKMRGALISFILRKACNLSTESRGNSSGTIDNIFVSDTEQLSLIPMFAAPSFYAPAQVAIGLALVYQELGPSTFFSIAFLFATLPIIGMCGAGFGYFIKKKIEIADQRIKLTKEIISGIRIIKYFAWEIPFGEKIKAFRLTEIKYIIYIFSCWVGLSAVLEAVPVIQPVIIFYAYSQLGNNLTYTKAFTSLTLFYLLTGPISQLPGFFQHYFNAKIACERILKVLNSEERDNYVTRNENETYSITLENASFGWVLEEKTQNDKTFTNLEKNEAEYEMVQLTEANDSPIVDDKTNRGLYTLQNLNLSIEKGFLVAVVGSVGCGKSSLIQAILGEMYKTQGSINLNGKIAYHAQQPWILNRTLRENITLGKKVDENRLNDVLAAVALDVDIRLLPAGLDTEIGEKGINLSGGQRSRVSIARCLVSDADIFLLDDPLAAVDAHTADHLYHIALKQFLKGKTVILVTHALHFLYDCDKVLVMSGDGKISAFCKYDELAAKGIELNHLNSLPDAKNDEDQDEEEEFEEITGVTKRSRTFSSDKPRNSERQSDTRKRTLSGLKKGNSGADDAHDGSKLILEEENKEGLVESSVYEFFIRTGGIGVFCSILVCVFCQKAIAQVAIFWLAYWGSVNVRENLSVSQNIEYLSTYAWLNTVGVAFAILRTILASVHGVQGGKVFHNKMLDRVLAAPQTFFDTTPVGRILNRFTGDIQQSDQGLAALLVIALSLFCDCISGVIAIAIATQGYFLLVVAPLIFAFYKMQHFYRLTNIQARRLWNVSRSPIFTELSSSLTSIVSLRSYDIVEENIARLETRLDEFLAISYMRFKISSWLNIRLDSMGGLCSYFVAVFTVASSEYGSAIVSAGGMAVSLSYAFSLPSLLSFTMALVGEIEGMMSAVERIKEYAENVPQEELDSHKAKYLDNIPPDWPTSGKIVLEDVEMRYRDGPLVLNKVSFEIADKEKVGIVGRTGSGKSSLLNSIYRFENLYSGASYIDGIDISKIPLSILRRRLCIIPQEPILFCATLRFNLDPFDEWTDLRLWEVIETVGLKDMVQALPKQLLHDISEGGENLSVGQRQMLCFGRALLRNPKIVFLDEATAAVDNVTDSHMQNMIRTKLANCTILSIAHRLHTIIDSDRVIMLNNGVVCENDNPSVLIKNGGMFAELWKQYEQAHNKNELKL